MDDFKHIPNHAQPEMLHIRMARRAGVTRGINASIQALEELRLRHSKRSSGYSDLSLAIIKLQELNIDEVEG